MMVGRKSLIRRTFAYRSPGRRGRGSLTAVAMMFDGQNAIKLLKCGDIG